MGYYASGYGEVTSKKKVDIEKINDLMHIFVLDYMGISPGGYIYDIYIEYEKYYEEEVTHDLDILAKEGVNGYIRYEGEEDAHWEYILKDNKWYEDYPIFIWPDNKDFEKVKNFIKENDNSKTSLNKEEFLVVKNNKIYIEKIKNNKSENTVIVEKEGVYEFANLKFQIKKVIKPKNFPKDKENICYYSET